jgi:hypothetical protein
MILTNLMTGRKGRFTLLVGVVGVVTLFLHIKSLT